jgi:hypothetical protein
LTSVRENESAVSWLRGAGGGGGGGVRGREKPFRAEQSRMSSVNERGRKKQKKKKKKGRLLPPSVRYSAIRVKYQCERCLYTVSDVYGGSQIEARVCARPNGKRKSGDDE